MSGKKTLEEFVEEWIKRTDPEWEVNLKLAHAVAAFVVREILPKDSADARFWAKQGIFKRETILKNIKRLGIRWRRSERANKALSALSSLKAMLEGDAGEDEKKLREYIRIQECMILGKDVHLQMTYDEMLACFERFSAKAKIGEAEIKKAKREMLEELTPIVLHDTLSGQKFEITANDRCYSGCPHCIIDQKIEEAKK